MIVNIVSHIPTRTYSRQKNRPGTFSDSIQENAFKRITFNSVDDSLVFMFIIDIIIFLFRVVKTAALQLFPLKSYKHCTHPCSF